MQADDGAALSAFRPGDEEALLDLEWMAAEPYAAFVYDDAPSARRASRLLLEKGCAEFLPPYCTFARSREGKPIALMVCLSRSDLLKQRVRAAMVLRSAGFFAEGSDAARRVSLAVEVLLKPVEGDLYLSRIAVLPEHRGLGLGKALLGELARLAGERGATRIALEVSPQHPDAIKLYRRNGFVDEKTARVVDPVSGRELVYHHMARAC